MRWQGLLSTTPIAAAILALAELTRLPLRAHHGDPSRLLAALAHLVSSAIAQFAVPAALLVAAGLAVLAIEKKRLRGTGYALLGALAVAQIGHARMVLAAYPPFEWIHVVNTGFVGLAIALGLSFSWLASGTPARGSAIGGATLAVASLVLSRAHYLFFVGAYPTMHACALQLAFLGLTLGLAIFTVSLPAPSITRGIALAVAPLALLAVLDLPASAWARPYVVAYTELGRGADVARALSDEREDLLPDALPAPRTDPLLAADDGAERRFADNAGLPSIDDLDLSDYDVLLVMSDATRYDRTSLARGRRGPTPNLARLERRGAFVMTRAIAPSNGTFPSIASMLSMTPVSFAELDVRARFWRGRLRHERTTAPEAMRRAGRATFWVGHDHDHCFSEHIRGVDQGFDAQTLVPQAIGADPDADRIVADRAIEAIRAHRGQRYFGLVFFVSPHDDYAAHYPRRAAETPSDRYDQELRFMDEQLGRVIDAVDLDHTILIFAGDHGEAFGEHGHEHHLTSLYDEQIRVPLVISIGGRRGARIEAPTSLAYVLPWLLLRGEDAERSAALSVLHEDVGPMMRVLDGAVVSEMISEERQEAALVYDEHTVIYDVLADVVRIYDVHDTAQEHDLREDRPDLLERFVPVARRYRRMRYAGRRFRFVDPLP